MSKTYIRLSGRWTAAIENEKATIQFIREHMQRERVPEEEINRVVRDLKVWFKNEPDGIKNHTITVRSQKNESHCIVSRIPKNPIVK